MENNYSVIKHLQTFKLIFGLDTIESSNVSFLENKIPIAPNYLRDFSTSKDTVKCKAER
ncbi:MAG: hypothetical protein ACKOX3_08980 [Bacteroidota bacterium]